MVGILKELERGARAELLAERFQQFQISEVVAGSLEEQHRNTHVKEMLRAFVRWLPGRMKWKSKKHETANSRQWQRGLRLRSHPSAKRFAAGKERQFRQKLGRFQHHRAQGGLPDLRRI